MASFMTALWESIFTPGPTSTLVTATNASFAALQAILAILLLATHSVHFIVLSTLCAGLWIGVNWFVKELEIEAAKERARTQRLDTPAIKRNSGNLSTDSEWDKVDEAGEMGRAKID